MIFSVMLFSTDPQPTLAVNEEKDLELCYFTFHKDCVAVRDGRRYIKIKLCPGNVYVYRLVATIPHSAYCFGKNSLFSCISN